MIRKIDNKATFLLKQKTKAVDKIKYYDSILSEEKDNEESWPGHASTRYQDAEKDKQVWLAYLQSVENELNLIKTVKNKTKQK
jgi:hypothetical protein